MSLNQEAMKKWRDALLFGPYDQAFGQFVAGDPTQPGAQFCCLAVLTDVAIKEGVENVRWVSNHEEPEIFHSVEDLDMAGDSIHDFPDDMIELDEDGKPLGVWKTYGLADLPPPVVKWAGLEDSNPVLDCETAITRNDDQGQSFADIAEAIAKEMTR